jgi:hypothetical protein
MCIKPALYRPPHRARSTVRMLHEPSSRRPSFRQGTPIRLGDGQTWILAAPPDASEWKSVLFGPKYKSLLEAMHEVDSAHEKHLAEMAFGIFLLSHNYYLSPDHFQQLLRASPGSSDSNDWQHELRRVIQEHLQSFLSFSADSSETISVSDARSRIARLRAWLRNHPPFHWWSFHRQNL